MSTAIPLTILLVAMTLVFLAMGTLAIVMNL